MRNPAGINSPKYQASKAHLTQEIFTYPNNTTNNSGLGLAPISTQNATTTNKITTNKSISSKSRVLMGNETGKKHPLDPELVATEKELP